MTSDIGMAFVVVTHLAPDHESMLGELLARHTILPVVGIEDGTTVEANRIYVIDQTPELKPLAEPFLGRLHALADAYEPLARVDWKHVPLRDVVMPQLEPHLKTSDQVQIDGPEVLLRPKAALALGLVIHELSTNAARYGGVFCSRGQYCRRVASGWSITPR